MAESFGIAFDPSPIYDTVPRETLTSTGALVDVMQRHPEALARAGLEHLVPFGVIYLDVTTRAHRRLEAGGYVRPDVVEEAMPNFAQKWFNHLIHYADGDIDEIPRVWMLGFEDSRMLAAEPATQFSIGMCGHIDYDLEYTLDDVNAPKSYKPDYTHHIGDVLAEAAFVQAEGLLPVNGLARYVLTRGVLQLISAKREIAWQNGRRLMALRGNEHALASVDQQLEQYALQSGKFMLRAGDLALKGLQWIAPDGPKLSQAAE